MSPGTTTLGTHMKNRRRELGINQSDAARRATQLRRSPAATPGSDSRDVGRTTWTNWESDKQIPSDFNQRLIEGVLRWEPGSVRAILNGGQPTPLPAATVTALPTHPGELPPDDDFVRELRAMDNVSPEYLDAVIRTYWADRAREEKQLQDKYRRLAQAAGS